MRKFQVNYSFMFLLWVISFLLRRKIPPDTYFYVCGKFRVPLYSFLLKIIPSRITCISSCFFDIHLIRWRALLIPLVTVFFVRCFSVVIADEDVDCVFLKSTSNILRMILKFSPPLLYSILEITNLYILNLRGRCFKSHNVIKRVK